MELFDCFDINEYAIDPEPDKQLFYRSIYSLKLVNLETFNLKLILKLT